MITNAVLLWNIYHRPYLSNINDLRGIEIQEFLSVSGMIIRMYVAAYVNVILSYCRVLD